MEQFKSNSPPVVFIKETLPPADPRGHSAMFDHAKETELAGLEESCEYEIVLKEGIPKSANVLGGALSSL